MATKNPKRKKANSNLKDPKRTRPSKVHAVIHHRSAKQSGKRAEEALHTEKQRFQTLSENAPFGMVMINRDGTFAYINPKFKELFGYNLADIPDGRTWFRKAYRDPTYRHDVISTWVNDLKSSSPEEKRPRIFRVTCQDGTEKIINFIPVQLETGENLMTCENITERKQAEEALRESEERYRTILDNIEDGYYEVDLIGNFTFFNDSLCRMLGYSKNEMIGMGNQQYTDQENRKKLFEAFNRVYRTGKPTKTFDWEVIRKDGAKVFGEVSLSLIKDSKGQPTGFRGIARDITERKQAEEFLRSERDKFRGMLLAIHDGVDIVNKDYIIEFQNELLRERFGDKTGEKCYAAYMGLEEPCHFCSIQEAIKTGSATRVELVGKDGRNYELNSSPFTDVDGNVKVIELVRDITERKRAEEALRQESLFRSAIIDHVTEGLCVCHETVEFPHVAFTVWNDRMIEITGYTMNEINRLGWYQTIYPDPEIQARAIERMARMRQGDDIVGEEWEITRADGEKRLLSISTSVLQTGDGIAHVLALMQDITERKLSEEALRQSEEKYRTILENIADGYYEVDLPGNFTLSNHSVCELFGYSKDELMGMNNRQYTDAENARKLYQAFNKVYRTGEPTKGFGWEIIRKDGTKRYIEASVSLMKNKSGQPIGFRGIVRDITGRKQAEEALQAEKQKFQTLSEQAPFGLMMISKDGAFEYINPKFKELFGYDLSDVPDGRTWFRKAYPDPTYRHHVILDWINDLESSMAGEKRSRVFTADCKDGTKKIINFISVQLEKAEQLVACEDITERNRAEKALQESEEKYRQLADFLPEMVYESDKNGKILFANRCAFEAFGHTQEDFDKGLTISEMIIPEDRGRVKQNFQMLLEEKKLIGNEYTALRKDHTTFPVIASANVIIQDNKPVGVRGVVIDITERKRAEEALKESEEKYRLLVENAAEAIFVAQDGMLKFTNRKATEMIGYSKEELTPKPFQEFIHSDDRGLVLDRHLQRLRGQGLPSIYPFRIVNKSGNVVWVELNAVLITWEGRPATLNFLSDITERRHAEEALRESQQLLKKTFASLRDAVFIIDAETVKIMDCNPAASEMFGYTREEMVGQTTAFLHVDSATLEEFRKTMYANVKEKGFLYLPEFRMKRKKGEIFPTEHNVVSLEDDQGMRIGWVSVVRDITEGKRAEKEMAVLQEQLRQSQKMEAVGLLAGGIAHDFNNLLTIIKGYSQLSLLELKEGDLLKGNMEEIQKATDRAANLTGQLLAFSRRQVMQMKVFDFNTLLRDLENMLRRVIGEDIELVTILADDLGRTKTDPGQIEQVIMNLAVNARDAMPSGGKLIIETANVEFDEPYTHVHIAMTPGRYVMLSVSDTGVGMTPEVRERVFEPFFTTKEKGKGTGLGLSTVYGIVKQSGGNISVYSEPGQGTTVKIYFPRVEEENDALFRRDSVSLIPQGSETVLVVEDEPSVRSLATHILRHQGYRVLEAADGEEALRVAQECFGEINLLLTDVVMPRMGGKEVADRLKTLRPSVKVLFISGFPDEAIAHHGVLTPGIAFLQKPFSPAALAQKVREVLDREVK